MKMDLMKKYRLAGLLLSAVLLVCAAGSCRHDDPVEPDTPEVQVDPAEAAIRKRMELLPGIQQKILQALTSGRMWYKAVVFDSNGATVTLFEDRTYSETALALPISALICFDRSIADVPVVTNDGKEWKVNSLRTGIPVSQATDPNVLLPVCVWFDKNDLCFFLNNGTLVHFPRSREHLLDSFRFRQKENPSVLPDILKRTVPEGLKFELSSTDKSSVFVPVFDITCKSITVGGVPQVSGETSHDFSSPVIYRIELWNGETLDVAVSVRNIYSYKYFPTILIDTKGAPILDKVNYVLGTVTFLDKDKLYSDVDSLSVTMGIRGRGQSTWNMPKKPYKVKLDKKKPVFGIAKEKDWALLANYSDKSCLRNVIAMKLSEIVGMSWTFTMRPANVILNGKPQGLYCLTEHKETGKDRVNITLVTPADNAGDALTGGYYLELEQNDADPYDYTALYKAPLVFNEPERAELTHEQRVYVRTYFKDFENALDNIDFADMEHGYRHYIDLDSFIGNYLVQEITKNIDGNLRKSTFLTKERLGKLKMYHVWDFDLALGNCNYLDKEYKATNDATGWFIKTQGRTERGDGKSWYKTMFRDPAFVAALKAKWDAVKPALDELPDFIEDQADFIRAQADKNFNLWYEPEKYVWPNVHLAKDFQDEVNYVVQFYRQRIAWLDQNIHSR